jgi:hypothetical protein
MDRGQWHPEQYNRFNLELDIISKARVGKAYVSKACVNKAGVACLVFLHEPSRDSGRLL